MRVEEELQRKRAELLDEADQLAHRVEAIKKQVSAIDQVIAIYNPAHTAPLAAGAERKRSWQEVPIPVELTKPEKTAAIPKVLREAREPLSSANDPALPRFVTQVSAGLNFLMKRNSVRQVGTLDG